jgi:hypothetical protein
MERDSAEGCWVRNRYVVASVVHMREQRKRRGTAVLPVGEDWGRTKSGYQGRRMVIKNGFSEHPPHYPREGQEPI